MVLAVDVHYKEEKAKAVGVLFDWEDSTPKAIYVSYLDDMEEYIPGQFYKRELPCILKLLEQIDLLTVESIIVDGHCYVSNNGKLGLGGRLYKALESTVPVIGVAKKAFHKNHETVIEVFRGQSKNPLYISSIGISTEYSANKVNNMQGMNRIPTILKRLDQITKE